MVALGDGASIVRVAVMLTICHPVVNAIRRCAHAPPDDLATTALSDPHIVISVPVLESRTLLLLSTLPMLTPTTVTLTAPDSGAFVLNTLLGEPASIVNDPVKLLIRQLVVNTDCRSDHTPPATLLVIALCDRHMEATQPEPPTRTLELYVTVPMLVPMTVTLTDPDATTLLIAMLLGDAAFTVTATVKLRMPHPVTTICCSGLTPMTLRATTTLSDVHRVFATAVPRTRIHTL